LTNAQIKECQEIDLDSQFENGGRMSLYDKTAVAVTANDGEDEDKGKDVVIEDLDEDGKIDLSEIPF